MATPPAIKDYEAFGQLVRHRRRALGLSQEALATAALGNPDRKSFVSAIENNRLTKITSNTAMKLSAALGLTREDVPHSLRWPSLEEPSPIEERLRALEAQQTAEPTVIEDRAIARFLNAQLAVVLRRPMSEIYRERLTGGLKILRVWTGRPFGLQSLLVCYALSLLYVVAAGLGSFTQGNISIGAVSFFRTQEWAGTSLQVVLPYLGVLLLVLGVASCWYLVRHFGLRQLSSKETSLRLGGVALIAGVCCGVVDYLGTQTLLAAVPFTVPSIAAISTLQPRRAAFYGAAGGIIFGVAAAASSALSDETFTALLKSLSEGFIIGGIVGSCAGLASSLIARNFSHLRAGQLAAAGGGVGVGALVSLAGILVALNFDAISGGTLGFFAVAWVALPFANAALDFVSLGVSHGLGRYIEASQARPILILLVLLLDLVLAVALMVTTSVLIGLALRGVTWGLGIETLGDVFLETSASDPWGQGFWLTVMVLSTTTWTWFHFGLVVAPLAAGAFTRRVIETPASSRLDRARQSDEFDLFIGVLVSLRFIAFYLCWIGIALLPVLFVAVNPEFLDLVLWLGWRIVDLIM